MSDDPALIGMGRFIVVRSYPRPSNPDLQNHCFLHHVSGTSTTCSYYWHKDLAQTKGKAYDMARLANQIDGTENWVAWNEDTFIEIHTPGITLEGETT